MSSKHEPLDVLTSVLHEFEAEMIVGALNRNGIPAKSTGGFISNFKAEAPGSVRILVKRSDFDRAVELLDQIQEDSDFRGADSDEEVVPDEKPGLESEPKAEHPEVERAWKAALLGPIVFPPLLSLYSMWLLFKHDLLAGDAASANWRAQGALCLNLFVIVGSLVIAVWLLAHTF